MRHGQNPDSIVLSARFDDACVAVWKAVNAQDLAAEDRLAVKRLLGGTTVYFWAKMIATFPQVVARSQDKGYPQLQVLPSELQASFVASLRRANLVRAMMAMAQTRLVCLLGAAALLPKFPAIDVWDSFASGFDRLGVSETEARSRIGNLGSRSTPIYNAASEILSDIGKLHLDELVAIARDRGTPGLKAVAPLNIEGLGD